jgi:alkaline phosphatase D
LTTNRTILSYPSSPIPFRTFPDPRLPSGNHFRFVVSSCVTQNFPYVPFQGNTIKGFDLLARYLFTDSPHDSPVVDGRSASINSTTISESSSSAQLPDEILAIPSSGVPSRWADSSEHASAQPSAEFLLFLGDFIYADVPMYIGDDREAYRRLYRRNYQSTSFRKIYERLRLFPSLFFDLQIVY